jgi:alkanesulfonate monooxygenase SsuD/methylene tetrahydromethanopterin reductase-like flavin-dependent oxidoreductase (luciferase family)
MSPATFRFPGPLAVSVAQVDQMSGGRVEFGFGAGWFDAEHAAYAIPFPPLRERFDRYAEQLAIITGLWETAVGETFEFSGEYYTVTNSPALPKPAQRPRPPVLIGGSGAKRTPQLAASYADEYNVPFSSLEDTAAAFGRVREACAAAGRDEGSMTFSAAQVVCGGRTAAELEKRAAAIGRQPDELRKNGLAGTPDDIAAKIADYAGIGVTRMYLQVLDLDDLDHLELLAELIPAVG